MAQETLKLVSPSIGNERRLPRNYTGDGQGRARTCRRRWSGTAYRRRRSRWRWWWRTWTRPPTRTAPVCLGPTGWWSTSRRVSETSPRASQARRRLWAGSTWA
ncbi:unnamed protein product [Musa acuminata subsp. malaccensis]|uniref:(wild Malaysian banana) hypothetical protein n=1 Tax=Musa acuminata subsp. malaccensis TaxID=214687 RepID=A0A8D7BCU4_MUSAM|nr:unnamed protein product [Musa acuminata subsp. malaccensis]